jgi:hypothetical protein
MFRKGDYRIAAELYRVAIKTAGIGVPRLQRTS